MNFSDWPPTQGLETLGEKLAFLVQSTSTGELWIHCGLLYCVCVRLHDFANISVRLLIVHTVLLIRLLLSNTVCVCVVFSS